MRNRHVVVEGGTHYVRADVTCNGHAWWVGVDCGASLHWFFREGVLGALLQPGPLYFSGETSLATLYQHSAGA